jgi:uncharacterized membrane protein
MESENFATELSDQDRILIVFDYLGPLALISLVASRREFVKWHAKQGLVLSATVAALYVVMKMIHVFLTRFFWSIFGELFWACAWLAAIGVLVLIILCIVRGLEGERFKIPMLGDLADKL